MRGIVVTTSRNGNLVEYSMMAIIRLGQVRGWLQLYKYNGNLLQNRLMACSELPRAKRGVASGKVLSACGNGRMCGQK